MPLHVFYSWQADVDPKVTRYFIQDALKRAIRRLNHDGGLLEPIALDHDTRDETGTPNITDTILKKIEHADAYVADMTFATVLEDEDGACRKGLPNPNVMFERGYATAKLGSSRVVCVMNIHYGEPDGLMPFNVSGARFPITFRLRPDSDPAERKRVRGELVDRLHDAIFAVLRSPNSFGGLTLDVETGVVGVIANFDDHDGFVEAQLAELKREYPLRSPPVPVSIKPIDLHGNLGTRLTESEEMETDDTARCVMYQEMRTYYDAVVQHYSREMRTIRPRLLLENVGTRPANKIDVTLFFPEGFEVYDCDELPALPDKPESYRRLKRRAADPFSFPHWSIPGIDRLSGLAIGREVSVDIDQKAGSVHFLVEVLKHFNRRVLKDFAVVVPPGYDSDGFTARGELHSVEMIRPRPVEVIFPIRRSAVDEVLRLRFPDSHDTD